MHYPDSCEAHAICHLVLLCSSTLPISDDARDEI